jgi:diaminohydroxyphosphoribosylaminopyrimidine deaminase/5-amino-6-(5-phosphoribosylamino)uracil reductase
VNDEVFLQRALELAERGRFSVSPNPMVGCVVVRDGQVLGEGWHERAGEAHAEVNALRACGDARGATMYVTLEPCSHHGRTPPCAEAVIASGVSRVVIAMPDPNEIVDGRGIEALRKAGIDVRVGLLESEARRLNEKFVWSVTHDLPFVLVKAAMTVDGKLATVARESQWITDEAARERSLLLREEYDAILVGSGTVATDNPRLTRRLGRASTPWTRVVLDGDGDAPAHAQLFNDGGRTLVFTSSPSKFPNADTVHIEGRADFTSVLRELHARGIQSVMVEGGAAVHTEVLRQELWQKMILFVAPMIIGGANAPAIFAGEVTRLTEAHRFRFDRAELVGRDLMITAYPREGLRVAEG